MRLICDVVNMFLRLQVLRRKALCVGVDYEFVSMVAHPDDPTAKPLQLLCILSATASQIAPDRRRETGRFQ
jgi:hypothetical protein